MFRIFSIFCALFYLHPLFAQDNSLVFGIDEQRQVIEKMARFLQDNYVDAQKGKIFHESLLNDLEAGRFESFRHPRSFINQMNSRLLDINGDKHVRIVADSPTEQNLKRENPVMSILLQSLERQTGNRGFRLAGIKEQNIGYIELTSFEPVAAIHKKMSSAMTLLTHVDAVIIDLRENRGGDLSMVSELAGYFFARPVLFSSYYWRRGDYTEQYFTKETADRLNFSEIPLFILVSKKTFSAAEDFAYGMQALKRGTIIGEKTGGGANPGFSFNLDERFSVFIPTGRAINPVTGKNWETEGVRPDIEVSAGQALNTALDQAAYAARIYRQLADRNAVDAFWQLAENIQNQDTVADSILVGLLARDLIEEWTINKLAYYFMSHDQTNHALQLLTFNTRHFPASINAWDSLAEYCFDTGDRAKATEYYQRVLQIDSTNQHARYMLDRIDHSVPVD